MVVYWWFNGDVAGDLMVIKCWFNGDLMMI